jgi:uncharacterized membrane protein YfhO
MNSNPTTLSVDEQIDTRTLRLKIIDALALKPKIVVYLEQIENIESLIRQVCEEVTPNRCTATRGNTQNPNNPMYSTKYAKGWNDCIDEQRTKLNKIMGSEK